MMAVDQPELEDWTRDAFVRELLRVRGIAGELVERWADLDEGARFALVRQLSDGRNGNASEEDGSPLLTPRELEVVAALVTTGSTPGVASELGISESTVRTHVKNVLAKLQVHSRTQAVALMLRDGLLPLHPA
jgi:DNA-binding NarL/FixJ family response regulator